ncbi:MAG: hypothetical protein ABIO70_33905 [Pseudomonadota bacterium]
MRPPRPILLCLCLAACSEYKLSGDDDHPGDTGLVPPQPTEQREDRWDVAEGWGTDILFFGDTSSSMTEELQTLGERVEEFVADLGEYTEDWQLLAVTGPDGCGVGGIITPDTPDYAATFAAGILTPPGEDLVDEWGLYDATAAVEQSGPGGCNEGFLREDAMLSVVLISDEDDNSPGWDAGDPSYWQAYVDAMVAIKGAADALTISAVAGPLPDGCAGAEPGTGYVEAAAATGGEFLSICDPWYEHLDAVVDVSVARALFELTALPVVATIQVAVDACVRSDDWEYDPALNAVRFTDDPPRSGEVVAIRYEVAG